MLTTPQTLKAFDYFQNRKEIPSRPGYFVTAQGDVFNRSGRLLSPFLASQYHNISLKRADGYRSGVGVHRLVWETFNGPIPKGMWINHKNGDKLDNALENLELTTPQENHIHARDVLKRNYAKGESLNAKLNEEAIEAIRLLLAQGWSQAKVARTFLVSAPTISYIANGKRWRTS